MLANPKNASRLSKKLLPPFTDGLQKIDSSEMPVHQSEV